MHLLDITKWILTETGTVHVCQSEYGIHPAFTDSDPYFRPWLYKQEGKVYHIKAAKHMEVRKDKYLDYMN